MKRICLRFGRIRMIIRKFPEGYLVAFDRLDDDGDVEYGCSGHFHNNPVSAMIDGYKYFKEFKGDEQ